MEDNPLQFTNLDCFDGIDKTSKDDIMGGSVDKPIGSMICLWTDEPMVEYSDEEKKIIEEMIRRFA